MKVMELFNKMTASVADTSLNGRKFRLFLIGTAAGTVAFLSTCVCPDLGANLGLLFTFIGGMYMTFCGSNVASSIGATWATGKTKIDVTLKDKESSQDGIQ